MDYAVKFDRDNFRGLIGVFLAFLIIGAIYVVKPGVRSAPDFSCGNQSREEALINISSGESGSSIAKDLEAAGVVKSSSAFYRVAVSSPESASISPGIHRISLKLCAQDALVQLLDRSRISNLISISEGAWNREIVEKFEAAGFSKEDVSLSLNKVSPPAGFSSLEGLLFPAQYSFDNTLPLREILDQMIKRSLQEMSKAGFDTSSEKFTSAQLLTIASLLQAEGDERDFAKISQVVRNRLAKGMPLQFDSTVHYIQGTRGSVFLSTKSTLINSPYNTYRRYGLPPTPINNPGAKAMYAAAHPEEGTWLYFITVAPGDTRFTDSYDQFSEWKVLYKKNLRAGKFGSK